MADTDTAVVDEKTTDTGTTTDATAAAAKATADAAASAKATADAAAAKTVVTTDAKDAKVAVQADWPDDWRSKLAAGDEAKLKRLERFGAPADVLKSYLALEQRLSSGELKSNTPFPAKGTDAEKAAWRAEQGIPEAPEKYDLKFDSGLVVGEADKPMVDAFLKSAHEANMRPEHAKSVIEWYFKEQGERLAARQEGDETARTAAEDTLRPEWGNDYRRNVNLINGFLDTAPEGVRDQIKSARLPDGTAVMNSPDVLRWLLNNATQINPVTTIIPGSNGANIASGIEDEIASIEKVMRENRPAYNKDEKMQARLRELYGAREKIKK